MRPSSGLPGFSRKVPSRMLAVESDSCAIEIIGDSSRTTPRAPLLDDLDAHAADRMSAAVTAADRATSGKHCAQCGTWLPRDEYSKNQRKKPGNWSCTPCVENGLRAEREMDRMLAAADDNGDARQEARRKARREFRAAAAAPAPAPAPAPGPAPRPPGLERRGVTAAPSSIAEATTPSTHSTAPAPRVDPSAATFAIGRAADEGQNAKQQLKILCDKFSASLTVAAVTDDVPRGSYAFECVVDGVRRGVGTARSKKDAKERAAALALRALARQPPGAAPTSREAYTDRTRAPGRRGAADLKGARGSGVLGGAANAAVEPVAAAAAPPPWQRAPGPQVGPPGFL